MERTLTITWAATFAFLFEPAVAAEKGVTSERIVLKKVPVKQGAFLPGRGIGVKIPKEALSARAGRILLLFFDLDGDGKLQVDAEDGFAIDGLPFVVRLPGTLLLETGQYDLAFEENAVKLRRQDLPLAQDLVRDASSLTDLRIRAGLPPVALDVEASRACEKHCEYLKRNRLSQGQGRMKAHEEEATLHGYSEEGQRAGKGSALSFLDGSYRSALCGWYSTVWHAVPLLDPAVRSVGVASKDRVSMIYPYVRKDNGGAPFLHPAPGARGVPRSFNAEGEIPNPVPGTQSGTGCGFPVFVILGSALAGHRLQEAVLEEPGGKRVKGTMSCPQSPANLEWPSNSGAAVFIPSRPLLPKARYRARFTFDGVEKSLEWQFMTGAAAFEQ